MQETIVQIFNTVIQSNIKYPIIFVMSFVEGMPILGSFFPGGTIAFLIGSQVPTGLFNPWLSFVLIGTANFLGDLVGFYAGRYSHSIKIVRKIVEKENLNTAWELFDKNLFYFVVFGRLIPVFSAVPSLLAGARMIKTKRYITLSLLGAFTWATAGVFGGALIGEIFGKYAVGFIIILTALAVLYSFTKKQLKKS